MQKKRYKEYTQCPNCQKKGMYPSFTNLYKYRHCRYCKGWQRTHRWDRDKGNWVEELGIFHPKHDTK